MRKILIILFFLISHSLLSNDDTTKIAFKFKKITTIESIHLNRIFTYNDSTHIYIAIDPKYATYTRITIFNPMGGSIQDMFLITEQNNIIIYNKPKFNILIIVEIYDDIIIDTQYDSYTIEIK